MLSVVEIFADGACKGNPGPGGWGVLLRLASSGKRPEKELCGGDPATTNNRMELTAAIQGLTSLKRQCKVRLHTDSKYVIDGITKWIDGWKRRGWTTADGGPVKNEDLWRQLDKIRGQHEVEWIWVKGHSGHVDNERADALANRGCAQLSG